MKKRTKTALAMAAVLLVLAGLHCVLILPLNGSIVHKAALTRRVREYVAETYGEGFTVVQAIYDLKMDTYSCYVQSDTSVDTHFRVYEGKDDALTDYYDFEVLQKENTIGRLTRQMDDRMERDFLPAYPWECVNYMCGFEQDLLDSGTAKEREGFVLDMALDMQNPPLPLELTLWVVRDDPSWEALAESLRKAAETADSLSWNVSLYSMTLHKPVADDEKPVNTATDFCVYQIPREAIDADSLWDYLKRNTRSEEERSPGSQ